MNERDLSLAGAILLGILLIPLLPVFGQGSDMEANVKTVVIQEVSYIVNWNLFKEELKELKQVGVDAISSGVAWNLVEKTKGYFQWEYYRTYVEAIAEAGLFWIPIITVHYVPSWVWRDYPDAGFVNEFNETSEEYLSYWHPQTRSLIENVYSRFFSEFSDYSEIIYGVYVSAGMWSELMYPWRPRPAYYGYDVYARADFRDKMNLRYGTIEDANAYWGTSFSNWTDVNPPLPNVPYVNMWNDFLSWYNSTLVEFGDWILGTTRKYYDGWIGIHFPMKSVSEQEGAIKLGHLDYDAIFSTVAKHNATPSYTDLERHEAAMRFSGMSRKYDLPCWAENAGIGADLTPLLSNLLYGGYDVYCYYRMDSSPYNELDLFDSQGNPTPRFHLFKNFITQWDPAPAAIFECTSPIAKEAAIFNASETAPIGGTIISYEWDFGDNTTATATNPTVTHVYDKAGNYTVTLNITDSQGLWNTGYKQVTVKSPDVNDDGSANVRDFILVAKAFGAWPARYNWNSAADIDSDNMVNVTDLHLVANYFEQSVDSGKTHYNSNVDFNSDGVINGTDMVILAEAYGSVPSNPNWNPGCDLNNNSIISMTDRSIDRWRNSITLNITSTFRELATTLTEKPIIGFSYTGTNTVSYVYSAHEYLDAAFCDTTPCPGAIYAANEDFIRDAHFKGLHLAELDFESYVSLARAEEAIATMYRKAIVPVIFYTPEASVLKDHDIPVLVKYMKHYNLLFKNPIKSEILLVSGADDVGFWSFTSVLPFPGAGCCMSVNPPGLMAMLEKHKLRYDIVDPDVYDPALGGQYNVVIVFAQRDTVDHALLNRLEKTNSTVIIMHISFVVGTPTSDDPTYTTSAFGVWNPLVDSRRIKMQMFGRSESKPGVDVTFVNDFSYLGKMSDYIPNWLFSHFSGSFDSVYAVTELGYPAVSRMENMVFFGLDVHVENETQRSKVESFFIELLRSFDYPQSIGITDVAAGTAKTVVAQGHSVCFNTTVMNYGLEGEAFNLSLYANNSLIETEKISLAKGGSSTVMFEWNTTDSQFGDYEIEAVAELLENETDTSDNLFVYGTVTVSILGDINGDGRVNILDISRAAVAYKTSVGDPLWDANADLDEDGEINILDITMIAKECGKGIW